MHMVKQQRPQAPSAPIYHPARPEMDRRSSIAPVDGACHGGEAPLEPRAAADCSGGHDEPQPGLAADLLIRAAGLLGIGLSALACDILYHLLHRGGGTADPTIGQYALAVVAFLGASAGSGLLYLGRHIHDRIEVAERWRRRW